MGLEPMISRTTIWRANQLHHTHHTEPGGIRTPDNLIKSQVLCQLSYTPLFSYNTR